MTNDDFEKPYISTLLMICRAIGYGRVMQAASDAWRQIDPIGAISLGPCYGSLNNAGDNPDGEHMAPSGKPIDGYPLQLE